MREIDKQHGEREKEFGRLFYSHYPAISGFFVSRGLSQEVARELAQDTFLQAYRGFAQFRGESSGQTWLFRIARNLLLNEFRRRSAKKRGQGFPSSSQAVAGPISGQGDSEERGWRAEEPVAPSPGPLDEALTRERMRLLREAVDELPASTRQVLLLRVDQGLKYREIAEILRLPMTTVRVRLFQARRQLREKLSGHFSDLEVA